MFVCPVLICICIYNVQTCLQLDISELVSLTLIPVAAGGGGGTGTNWGGLGCTFPRITIPGCSFSVLPHVNF